MEKVCNDIVNNTDVDVILISIQILINILLRNIVRQY